MGRPTKVNGYIMAALVAESAMTIAKAKQTVWELINEYSDNPDTVRRLAFLGQLIDQLALNNQNQTDVINQNGLDPEMLKKVQEFLSGS